jgi:exopolysaccharide biosynthesis polyprenyl glycosylphosphotransferase
MTIPEPPGTVTWPRRYAARLFVTDLVIVAVAVFGSQVLWFGLYPATVHVITDSDHAPLDYYGFSVLLIAAWVATLTIYATRDRRVVGIGSMEYKRIFDASLRLFGLVAITAVLIQLNLARGYIVTAFPAGVVLLIASRWAWRRWLMRRRWEGHFSARVLLVGSKESVGYIIEQLARFPFAGYRAVGACIPDSDNDGGAELSGIPIVGNLGQVVSAVNKLRADTVILTSSDHLSPAVVRRISWSLESMNIDLAVAPALTDIAGPRIHIRPLAGLPLLHVEVPRYEGSKRSAKAVFDLSVAVVTILVLSPVFLVLALLVGLTSRGPIFFRQKRVGLNGEVFSMIKFRTMVADAEELQNDLAHANEGQGLLFKIRDDPRITKVGRVLRRYSLDELPQFFNVVRGDMSIVGPRPPLVNEAERYEPEVRRRLLVRPGITGPWQISGRSDLSWDDGVRLDLYYVENWSLTGDLVLIWRTVNAVIRSQGAY